MIDDVGTLTSADECASVRRTDATRRGSGGTPNRGRFASECDKFDAEIAKERRINKLTVAELDEEEHSLERLRRWWRELRARDIFTVPDGVNAEERLKHCEQVLDAYSDEVYRAVHGPLGQEER
jgi:hypothetical protein